MKPNFSAVRIPIEKFEHHSGCENSWYSRIPYIKRNHYKVENVFLGGDQPKVFVRIYQYGPGIRRSNQSTWPSYLAKFARKWYPVESITEHLITVLGKTLGIEMAETQLCVLERQLRLTSKYFLKENERLVHGADLLSKYLGDDQFVQQIDERKMEGELFSYEDARSAIQEVFPSEAAYDLICKFDQMLVLDCLLGVNDRHFFNWGIITDVTGEKPPRFAPLFDTSRALMWNYSEQKLTAIVEGHRISEVVEAYIHSSHPKMSMPGLVSPSHFEFMEILRTVPGIRDEAQRMMANGVEPLLVALNEGFRRLLSQNRLKLIEEILRKRFSLTLSILSL